MHYLTIDGMVSGSGIRDSAEGGYVKPSMLGLSKDLTDQISRWLTRYEEAHYRQYDDRQEVEMLDIEGLAIARQVRGELPDSKVDYFSSARMKKMAL